MRRCERGSASLPADRAYMSRRLPNGDALHRERRLPVLDQNPRRRGSSHPSPVFTLALSPVTSRPGMPRSSSSRAGAGADLQVPPRCGALSPSRRRMAAQDVAAAHRLDQRRVARRHALGVNQAERQAVHPAQALWIEPVRERRSPTLSSRKLARRYSARPTPRPPGARRASAPPARRQHRIFAGRQRAQSAGPRAAPPCGNRRRRLQVGFGRPMLYQPSLHGSPARRSARRNAVHGVAQYR